MHEACHSVIRCEASGSSWSNLRLVVMSLFSRSASQNLLYISQRHSYLFVAHPIVNKLEKELREELSLEKS